MKKISRLFQYLYYFHKAETKELRTEAFLTAKSYYAGKSKTREDFQAFQRGYKNYICSKVAREQLAKTSN
jgi:hypothetical protein